MTWDQLFHPPRGMFGECPPGCTKHSQFIRMLILAKPYRDFLLAEN